MLKELDWYIDTSVFLDFIRTNIRVGFSESEPDDGKTIIHVKLSATKNKQWAPLFSDNGIRYAFELTSNIDRLRKIGLFYNKKYYYSELIKAEVFRNLRKFHSDKDKKEISNWWNAFCSLMWDYKNLPINFDIGPELSDLALGFPIKKNVQDYIHLIIAKKYNKAFITSDKFDDQILELRTCYYAHIYHFEEVKNAYSDNYYTNHNK